MRPLVARWARRLRRARVLPRQSWVMALRVVPSVVGARLALAVLPYRTVVRLFAPRPAAAYPLRPNRVRATLRMADWTGRTFLSDRPCLSQALAARWLLAREGYATDLRFGVRPGTAGVEAHAWLEHDGTVVLGGADSPVRYTPFAAAGDDPATPLAARQ